MRKSAAFEGGALFLERKNSAEEMGDRIAKHSYDKVGSANGGLGNLVKSTYYILDAQSLSRFFIGRNTMSVYERSSNAASQSVSYEHTEKHTYGSSRLGVMNVKVNLLGSAGTAPYSQTTWTHRIGQRTYELSNHLGNVLSVISDKVIPHSSNSTTVDYYMADIRQSTDYSPFGVTLSGRDFTASGIGDYRYSFMGYEADNEVKGQENSYTTEFRQYDPRLGRWLSLDPLAAKYTSISPYVSFANNPISVVDKNGDSIFLIIWATDASKNSYGHAAIAVQNYKEVQVSFEFGGQTISYTTYEPDGTFTYFDLWPLSDIDNSKEGSQKVVDADYQHKNFIKGKPITRETILFTDVSEGGKSPDGVIALSSNYEMDVAIEKQIWGYLAKNKMYVGTTNNCSDFALFVVSKYIGDNKVPGGDFGKEDFGFKEFTTPNELYKDTRALVKLNSNVGKVLKQVSKFKQKFISLARGGIKGESESDKY